MRNISVTLILIGCWLKLATCEPSNHATNHILDSNDLETVDNIGQNNNDIMDMEKRSERYAFGLGRRAYTYTSGGSGVKRLPVYNFGLGKRARPYSFGLGKRSGDFENPDYQEYDGPNNDEKLYGLLDSYYNIKRNRPYSFGLGKRELISEEKRRFDFGLGKREISDEERQYNFGIGKREANNEGYPFNFGLGKREVFNEKRRYDFGLGKR